MGGCGVSGYGPLAPPDPLMDMYINKMTACFLCKYPKQVNTGVNYYTDRWFMIFLQNSAFVSKIMDNERRENRGGLVYSHTYPHMWNIVHGLIGSDRLRLRNSCILVCKSLRSRKSIVLAKPSNFRMHSRHHCLLIAINKNNHEALTF